MQETDITQLSPTDEAADETARFFKPVSLLRRKPVLNKAVKAAAILLALIPALIFTKMYMGDMQDMLKNSNLPHMLGARAAREFSEKDGGDYMDTNYVETGDGIWAVITYTNPKSGISYNSINGTIWRGNPHEPSFNEEFHVFGFQAGQLWTDDVAEFFTEKEFTIRSDTYENDKYYWFQHPNGSYYLRFGVNFDGYVFEIMVSL
jgi:hypothetical protein